MVRSTAPALASSTATPWLRDITHVLRHGSDIGHGWSEAVTIKENFNPGNNPSNFQSIEQLIRFDAGSRGRTSFRFYMTTLAIEKSGYPIAVLHPLLEWPASRSPHTHGRIAAQKGVSSLQKPWYRMASPAIMTPPA